MFWAFILAREAIVAARGLAGSAKGILGVVWIAKKAHHRISRVCTYRLVLQETQ
jgi:hypothetical protein